MPSTFTFSSEVFSRTAAAIQASAEEQARIERAVGRAIIERLTGKDTELTEAYAAIGGNDPVAVHIFSELAPVIARLDLTNARTTAVGAVNKGQVAAAKSASVRAENPVFAVENTALHTLAALGGREFARKFDLGK